VSISGTFPRRFHQVLKTNRIFAVKATDDPPFVAVVLHRDALVSRFLHDVSGTPPICLLALDDLARQSDEFPVRHVQNDPERVCADTRMAIDRMATHFLMSEDIGALALMFRRMFVYHVDHLV
jgi:hypothetical protein